MAKANELVHPDNESKPPSWQLIHEMDRLRDAIVRIAKETGVKLQVEL